MHNIATRVVAPILISVFLPCNLAGQRSSEAEDARLRADCRLAAQILTAGQPNVREVWAKEQIIRCDEIGPEVLIDLWEKAPGDTTYLNGLVLISSMRDQRILDVLQGVARNEASATMIRLAALRALATFVDSLAFVQFEHLLPDSARIRGLGGVDHAVVYYGSQPPEGDVPNIALTFVNGLAESAEDDIVRYAANRMMEFCDWLSEIPPICR